MDENVKNTAAVTSKQNDVVKTQTTANNRLEEKDVVKTGMVNCYCLNVRAKPMEGANVLGIIKFETRVSINMTKSTEEFYRVSVGGLEGFCMRKFITLL